jgi:hypothetical protein
VQLRGKKDLYIALCVFPHERNCKNAVEKLGLLGYAIGGTRLNLRGEYLGGE